MTIKPMLATPGTELPTGPKWSYEVKWDGYRALAVKGSNSVKLLSRNEKNLANSFPPIVAAISSIKAPRFVLDGEVVALDPEGRPSFQALQHRSTGELTLAYCAFDLLELGDESLLRIPLEKRRERLKKLVAESGVLLSEPLPGSPADIEREIRRLGLEGIVAKRVDSLYRPGERTDAWVKVRFNAEQEFVVGGYKPSSNDFESVLVGYYEGSQFLYAAKVRSGFTPHTRVDVLKQIITKPTAKCPFVNLPNASRSSHWGEGISEEDMTKLRWVVPRVVVQVAFVEWTRDGLLRHPKFVGVRDDKKPGEVRRDRVP